KCECSESNQRVINGVFQMTAVGRRTVVYALKLSDLVLMSSCFACSAVPLASKSSALSIAQFFSMRVKIQNLALFIALLLIWHAVFSLLGLYDSGRLSSRRAECLRIIKATSIGTLFILVAARFLNITMVTPSFIVIFWVVSSCTTLLAR